MHRISGGYILVARSTLESELMDKPPLYAKLWLWMLLTANFKDTEYLKRGQLLTTIDEMREAMGHKVGFSMKRPTRDEIRGAYTFFRKTEMITATKTTRGMIITILNYEKYQDPKRYEAHTPEEKSQGNQHSPHEAHMNPTGNPTGNPTQLTGSSSWDDKGYEKKGADEPHSEAHDEDRMKPTATPHYRERREECKKEEEEKNREKIFPGTSRAELLDRFENQNVRALVEDALEKIALTRKSGRVSESVVTGLLKKLLVFEPWKVGTGISKYINGEYYLDGKDERYLLGIIRNVTPRDYQEVVQQQAYSDIQAQTMQPKTYAQAQDAERRSMAQRLLQRRSDNEQKGNHSGRVDQAGHSLPGGKTQHG
jgi:hypothetical protein